MLAIATYIEEVKPGWRDYNRFILENLQHNFNIDWIFYISRQLEDTKWYYKIPNRAKSRCITSFDSLDDLATNFGCSIVNIQPKEVFTRYKSIELEQFHHPEDACYVFGPNHGVIEIVKDAYNVTIDVPGKSNLYSTTAVAMVLFDRFRSSVV